MGEEAGRSQGTGGFDEAARGMRDAHERVAKQIAPIKDDIRNARARKGPATGR
jgi:hypothetical protein